MIVPINLRYGDRTVDFCMDLDETQASDHAVLHYARQGLPCEPETCYIMLLHLKAGMVAVDGGANIGFFTLLMSKLVGDTGQVFAFEPGLNNLAKLKANLALNDCKNVKVIEQPLWSAASAIEMFHYADSGANSLWPACDGDKSMQMAATTLDIECNKVDLIKLDIEGAEVHALRGAHKLLRDEPVIVTEMNEEALARAGTSFDELRAMLRHYECFGLSASGGFPTWIPKNVMLAASRPNTNIMFAQIPQVERMWSPKVYV